MRGWLLILSLGLLGGCDDAPGLSGAGGAGGEPCPVCEGPEAVGSLADPALLETSGLSASRVHEGVWWLHNDSGHEPVLYAIDAAGLPRGRYLLEGALAQDFEDLALGPCPDGTSCIFVADIGDNPGEAVSHRIHRLPEPESLSTNTAQTTVAFDTISYRYPDGERPDAETLLVDPADGTIYVITKVKAGASRLYRVPADTFELVDAEALGELEPPEGSASFTAGDVHPAGAGVLLRTLSHAWWYPLEGDLPQALAGTPCPLPVAEEAQGEALGLAPSGDAFVTVSEDVDAELDPPLYRVTCSY